MSSEQELSIEIIINFDLIDSAKFKTDSGNFSSLFIKRKINSGVDDTSKSLALATTELASPRFCKLRDNF